MRKRGGRGEGEEEEVMSSPESSMSLFLFLFFFYRVFGAGGRLISCAPASFFPAMFCGVAQVAALRDLVLAKGDTCPVCLEVRTTCYTVGRAADSLAELFNGFSSRFSKFTCDFLYCTSSFSVLLSGLWRHRHALLYVPSGQLHLPQELSQGKVRQILKTS